MKLHHILHPIVLILLFTLQSCYIKSKIELSDFSKQLVSLYDSAYHVGDKDIVFHTYQDSLSYGVWLYAHDTRIMPIFGENYLGKTCYNGSTIYLFGHQDSLFYKGALVTPMTINAPRSNDDFIIYDPIVWNIVLHSDHTLSWAYTNGMDSITYERIKKYYEFHIRK